VAASNSNSNTGGSGYCCAELWDNASTSAAVLEPPKGSSLSRVAAGLSGKRWASFHVDVVAADQTTPYNISLYFLDFEQKSIRVGVKLMSGAGLVYKTIAPMAFVEDCSRGKYVSYTVTGDVRFRFIEIPSPKGNVRGIPPRGTISGVFFD
jgi:hypothetical protein